MVKNVDERIARDKTATGSPRPTPQRARTEIQVGSPQTRHAPQNHRRRRDYRSNGKRCRTSPTLVRTVLNASVGRQNDREAIADLLAAASGVASAAAPERAAVSPAPAPRANAPGMDAGKPDVSGVAPLGAKSDALSASPQSQPPRPPAPPFLARLNPQQPPADPLASSIDDISRMLGRKSE